MNFTDWLAEQAATRTDEIGDFAQGPACHPSWPAAGRNLEPFEDFVVREFGVAAVKSLHRAWKEFQKSREIQTESPFGGLVHRSVSRTNPARRVKPADPEPATQPANFWSGHPVLDKAALPMKPPGR